MSRVRRGLALLAFATLSGCAGPSPDERGAAQTAAIIDGEPSGATDDGIVVIHAQPSDQDELVCTASLVAPNLLLTARHCVSYFTQGYFTCSARGELTNSVNGAGVLGLHFEPSSVEVYGGELPRKEPLAHGAQIISTLSETICVNDLAFVVLDTPLDLPIVPMRLGRPAYVGEDSVLVGFGLDADESDLDYLTQPRRRKAGLSIADVGPDLVEDGVVRAPPRTVILQGPSGCIGDSGGPLLDAASGAILGVYSLQAGDSCRLPTIRHFLAHVPPFERLIEQAFEAAGAEPLREPEPEQGGAGGAGSEPSLAAGAGGVTEQEPAPTHAGDSGCTLALAHDSSLASELGLLGALAAAVQGIRRRYGRGRSRRRNLRN